MRNGIFHNPHFLLLLIFTFVLSPVDSFADKSGFPVISIIIDDIGYRNIDDMKALDLPGPIAYAIMPHSPQAKKMSDIAKLYGKDILLHLPMEAVEDEKNRFLGPGGLNHDMNEFQFISTLSSNFSSVPNIIGVNNHMGSLLTRDSERMGWLMDYLTIKKMFYIDSVTSRDSVASIVALKKNVPYLKRDVFLDNSKDKDYINSQFNELINLAKRRGNAIAIGHPHPETIEVLEYNLNRLEEYGVRLISLKEMMDYQDNSLQKISLH